MNNDKKKPVVISLGGSLLVPGDIDTHFIATFVVLIKQYVEEGRRFVIITGGGKTARRYMDAGREMGYTQKETDWIGIYSTRLNGQFVRTLFKDIAYSKVVTDPKQTGSWNEPVLIVAGGEPGWSTDYDAVLFALSVGASQFLNMSNIEYVYDKDPNKYDDAQKKEVLSWDEYIKLIPDEWISGLSSPFDPIASRLAQKNNIKVTILSGDLDNFKHYLDDEPFVGTLIS